VLLPLLNEPLLRVARLLLNEPLLWLGRLSDDDRRGVVVARSLLLSGRL
jgi:hypothetical protein